MDLGAFSVSLAVKDLERSRAFYEKLGFKPFGGDAKQGWLILKNRMHVIGLFQGMFDANILTFNPGWNQDAGEVDPFTDVRALQRAEEARGGLPYRGRRIVDRACELRACGPGRQPGSDRPAPLAPAPAL